MKTTITVDMPRSVEEALVEAAEANGMKPEQLIEIALAYYVDALWYLKNHGPDGKWEPWPWNYEEGIPIKGWKATRKEA